MVLLGAKIVTGLYHDPLKFLHIGLNTW